MRIFGREWQPQLMSSFGSLNRRGKIIYNALKVARHSALYVWFWLVSCLLHFRVTLCANEVCLLERLQRISSAVRYTSKSSNSHSVPISRLRMLPYQYQHLILGLGKAERREWNFRKWRLKSVGSYVIAIVQFKTKFEARYNGTPWAIVILRVATRKVYNYTYKSVARAK